MSAMSRERAAAALDATHAMGERGPKTFRARALVARWLDLGGRVRGLAGAVEWLESVAKLGAAEVCRCGHPPHSGQCPAVDGCWCDTFFTGARA